MPEDDGKDEYERGNQFTGPGKHQALIITFISKGTPNVCLKAKRS
jgi:hypothetical protein